MDKRILIGYIVDKNDNNYNNEESDYYKVIGIKAYNLDNKSEENILANNPEFIDIHNNTIATMKALPDNVNITDCWMDYRGFIYQENNEFKYVEDNPINGISPTYRLYNKNLELDNNLNLYDDDLIYLLYIKDIDNKIISDAEFFIDLMYLEDTKNFRVSFDGFDCKKLQALEREYVHDAANPIYVDMDLLKYFGISSYLDKSYIEPVMIVNITENKKYEIPDGVKAVVLMGDMPAEIILSESVENVVMMLDMFIIDPNMQVKVYYKNDINVVYGEYETTPEEANKLSPYEDTAFNQNTEQFIKME